MNNKLFEMIINQLAYFKEGSLEKFQQIFLDSLNHCEIFNLQNQGLCKSVYMNFLITIGIIEVYEKDRKFYWAYLRNEFVFTENNKKYQFGFYSPKVESMGFFFFEGFDIFPLANIYLEAKAHDVESFLSKLFTVRMNWSIERERIFQKIDWFDNDKNTTQKYCFEKHNWIDNGRNALEKGIYRAGVFSYERYYICVFDDGIYKTFDEETLFLASVYFIKDLKIESLFKIEGNSLLIPWKVRTPSLFKRSLASISNRVEVNSKGYTYSINNKILLNETLNYFVGKK